MLEPTGTQCRSKPWIGPRAVPARSAQGPAWLLEKPERPGAVVAAASRDGSRSAVLDADGARANLAPIAWWLEPTRLTLAAGNRPLATASHAATHCQAAAAIRPSPRIRFGLIRGPAQLLQAASSGASVRGLSPRPSQSSSPVELLPS